MYYLLPLTNYDYLFFYLQQHVDLFNQIKRILRDNAPFLFTTGPKAIEGFVDRWFGGSRMYWSNFSIHWYEITLEDLGFEFISKSLDVKEFEGGKDPTYYLLYRR